jgi:general secretion pathway protein F
MHAYDYAALDKQGKRLLGTIMATSASEARELLQARSLAPIELQAATHDRKGVLPGRQPKIGHRDLTRLTRHLAFLIGAGTPVEEALKSAGLQFENAPARSILLEVRSRVLEGARLSDALRGFEKSFPALYVSMVASGEASGALGQVLERLASNMEASQKIRNKILAATAYPIVLGVVALLVIVVLMVFVVPKIVVQFDSFGQELPWLTRATIWISNWLLHWGWLAAGLLALMGLAIWRALQNPDIARARDQFLLRLPVLGQSIRNLDAARFARTMAALLESGLPTLAALEASRHILNNTLLREAVTKAANKVREGGAMASAFQAAGVFPPLLVQMVSGGEASGQLGAAFAKSAEYLEDEFERSTSVFLSLLEPLIILVLAGIVLLIIAAIFLPILRLNTLVF